MMFKKINNAHAVSDDGYIVKYNRAYISYQDGDRAIHIDAEFALEPTRIVIYSASISKWFKPNEDIIMTDEEKNLILKRVLAALKFLGVKTEVE